MGHTNSIIFFGTDEFAASILLVMLENGVNVKAIVTKPDKAKNRNKKVLAPVVKQFCLDRGVEIPLYQPEKASTSDFADILSGFAPDLFVVVSYGEIISEELLSIPRLMPINIHPSLLPKYRGAAPLRTALLNGDRETGVAIIEMVKAMDAGDIVKMEKMQIFPEEDHTALQKRVFKKSGKILLACLDDFEKGKVKKSPQQGVPTFTKKFTKDDLRIDWDAGLDTVLHKIRAFGDAPGAFCYVEISGIRLSMKITKAQKVLSDEIKGQLKSVSTIAFTKTDGWIVALNGGLLQILQVQLQNKKLVDVKDFINGSRGRPPVLV
ncbi:MAG: Methionyl-tRNA formyltransferase [Chlamydiia bacterium]|nr:Methionyl-tRNA formyltransferase [Chlamydiia bacterium]MCH9618440.1 Methionyl-tRNA formyltransferase [Chlamydiia bacterium]MCH9623766.1 Methionyl-tRNA formyltransferase [Chlamydiia bacterium]